MLMYVLVKICRYVHKGHLYNKNTNVLFKCYLISSIKKIDAN